MAAGCGEEEIEGASLHTFGVGIVVGAPRKRRRRGPDLEGASPTNM